MREMPRSVLTPVFSNHILKASRPGQAEVWRITDAHEPNPRKNNVRVAAEDEAQLVECLPSTLKALDSYP